MNCIRTVTQQVKNQPIGLISFASAMHGLIAMDAQGRPLTQVITWADTRASDYAEALKETPAAIVLSIDRHASSSNGAFVQDSLAAGKSASRCAERGQVIGIKDYIFTVSLANTGQIIVVLQEWVYLIFTRDNGKRRF